MTGPATVDVVIVPWAEGDLDLLRQLNAPVMMAHLGGPETEEQLVIRHKRYVDAARSNHSHVFKVLSGATREALGQVTFWERVWRDQPVYEIGWGILPAYQGRGIASAAVGLAIKRAATTRKHRFMHAFPSVDNAASNAICRKAGFTFVAECEFAYPPGHSMRCNEWRVDLEAVGATG
jgi:RimJ/RimL family protein N-acetyltransferase